MVNIGMSESVIIFSGYASASAHPLPDTGAPMGYFLAHRRKPTCDLNEFAGYIDAFQRHGKAV
jgi:hypothetical protein